MGWINPITWATHTPLNATNMNTIRDALKAIGDPWLTYAPNWTATTTDPVIGNGVISGRYQAMGKLIVVRININAGTSTTFGSGNMRVSLPVTSLDRPRLLAVFTIGTSQYIGATYGGGSDPNLMVNDGSAGGVAQNVTATVPAAFGNGSRIEVSGIYEAL